MKVALPHSPRRFRQRTQDAGRQRPWPELFPAPISRVADRIVELCINDSSSVLTCVSLTGGRQAAAQLVQLCRGLAYRADDRVLVVDAMYGNRMISRELEATDVDGLAEAVQLNQSPGRLIQERGGSLHILPAGRGFVHPAGDVDARLATMTRGFRGDFRFTVLIAAPPPNTLTAAAVHHSDGTLLLVELGVTPRQLAHQTIAEVARHGGRLIGALTS